MEREADGGPPSDLPAYAGVMARIAAFAAIEDLPEEMRAFVDARLAAHESARAAERQIRDLLAGLQAQPRRWPELAWAARSHAGSTDEPPAWQDWRDAGTALVDTARRRLAGEESPALSAATRRRLEAALAGFEKVRLKDDAARFARDWRALLERAESEAVPVSLLAGYEALAGRGAALAQSTALTAEERRAVDAWQARHAAETALVDDIRSVRGDEPAMLTEWLGHHVPLDGAGGVDPGDPDVTRWRHDADDHLRHIRALLAADGPHAAHVAAMPGARDEIGEAAGVLEERLRALDRATWLWRACGFAARARMTGRLPLDMPEWPDTLGEIRDAADSAAPGDPAGRHLARWLSHDARWRRDRQHVAALAGRLKDLERERPRYTDLPDDDAPDRRAWRRESEAIGDDLAAVGALADHERTAHLAACGMTVEAFASLAGAVPLWRATDDALARLDHWSTRAHDVLREGPEGPTVAPDDVERAGALIEEGRALPEEWAAASLPQADMEGAEGAVEAALHRLEAAQLTAACQAFTALCRSVNRERKAGRVHPLDAADYPRLLEALEDLAGRARVPQATRDLMDGWREAGRRWREERRETDTVVAKARALAEAGRTRAAADDPDTQAWRTEASALLTAARAMLADDTLKARHLDAVPGAKADLEAAVAAIETTLKALARAALLQRVTEIESRAQAAGQLPLDLPDWPGMLEAISGAVTDGAPVDGTVRALARRLDDDRRRRRDRDRLGTALDRLAKAQADRPRFGVSPDVDRAAWRVEAPAAAQEVYAAMEAIPEGERAAQLRALRTSLDALPQRLASVPAWLATDDALADLADWRQRARRLSDAPEPGDPRWRRGAAALLAEGRVLPDAWKAAGLPAGDMAGAEDIVHAATARIDAALLGDSLRAFVRWTHALMREARDRRVHPLDSRHMAPLRDVLGQLDDDPRLSADDRTAVIRWREAIDGWDGERQRAAEIVAEALALEPRLKGTGPLSDAWRRSAEALLNAADAGSLPADAHIRAAGASFQRIAGIVAALPERLADDDAVREDAGRTRHLLEVRAAMRRLREAPFDISRSVRWDGTGPLLRGDRLTWVDDEGRHDAVVEVVGHFTGPDAIDHLRLRPVDGTKTRNLFAEALRPLAANVTCRRLLWPDEAVRQRECERQYPAANAAFPLACGERVLPGDRIRWTLVRHPDTGSAPVEGDTPRIEAVVEAVEPGINDVVGDKVTLRVIRSWGMDRKPESGSTIRQELRSLFMRGCVRAPWDDETAAGPADGRDAPGDRDPEAGTVPWPVDVDGTPAARPFRQPVVDCVPLMIPCRKRSVACPRPSCCAINQRLWLLKKPLGEAREKVHRLEEDERTLTWMQKVDDSRMRRVERMVSDLEPQGRVRRMLMRLIGVKRPDMVRDIAGFLLEPVADELEELRKRLADARKEALPP